MLNSHQTVATIAVKDIERARHFYAEKLGLDQIDQEKKGGLTFAAGTSRLFVYQSDFAGTNKATAATWLIGSELDDLVRELDRRGVPFEHYDALPNMKREGHVHVAGEMRVAWFTDPDGNIHSLINS